MSICNVRAPEDEHLIQKIEAFFEEYLTSSDSESADDSELNTSSETLPGAGTSKYKTLFGANFEHVSNAVYRYYSSRFLCCFLARPF